MAKKSEETTLAAVPKAGALASYGGYGTKTGFENVTSDDLKTPFIKQLQPMSPEVTDGLPGAVPGAFYNTATNEVINMNDGLIVVPLGKKHHWVEWRPRENGGGFVASHAPGSPAVLGATPDPKGGSKRIIPSADGKSQNELIESHDVFVLILDKTGTTTVGDTAIFSFTSTKIKACRDWWTKMYMVKPRVPLFAFRAKISGFKDPKTTKGVFYNTKVTPYPIDGDWKASLIDAEKEKQLLDTAFALFEMYESGSVTPDYSKVDSSEAGGGGAAEVPF